VGKKILLKDIVIPKGTILETAPREVARFGNDHYECVIGLSTNTCGFFTYCIDEPEELSEWFEDYEEA